MPDLKSHNNKSPNGILSLIGNTPIVRLKSFDTGKCELYVKMECNNPGGSIKDRIGLSMIEAAEKDGSLKPGGTIVEATAGNTGIGLAVVAAQKGYKLNLVVPDKMSQEKIFHLKALGTKVTITRSDVIKGHPEYYQDLAAKIAKETPGTFYVNQFSNPANPEAHFLTTAPEIWEQMEHNVDAVVCGVGSGGTITGISRYFKDVQPNLDMVLADPAGSILTDYLKTGVLGEAGSWLVEGIGEDFIPSLCDLSRVKSAYTISDKESFETAKQLLLEDGILGGSSSGTLVAAAVRYCQDQKTRKRVVTFICDSGNKYLSKMFNEYWMLEQGLVDRKEYGDLRDVIIRRFEDGHVVAVTPEEQVSRAYARMKYYDMSQLPVMTANRVVGILDETDLLLALAKNRNVFDWPVSQIMVRNLKFVSPSASLHEVVKLHEAGYVAIVAGENEFYGLITKVDLLSYLKRHQKDTSRLSLSIEAPKTEKTSLPQFSTRAIHAGQSPAPGNNAIMTPIYQTSTYVQSSPGVYAGYDYGRTGNPTRTALEENLASLENGKFGICFSSGLAAADAVLHMLKTGDHVICGSDCYGGTYRLFERVFRDMGIACSYVDLSDLKNLKGAITKLTKLIWMETPTNPLLSIYDIEQISEIAHKHGIFTVVDNTFASPYLQNPLTFGADLVLHSSTKYIGGHSDVIGGAIITNDQEFADRLHFIQNAVGAVPGPMDCFLLLRSTKTLSLRMEQHSKNALALSQHLQAHPAVTRVYYPFLISHPHYTLAQKQMHLGGGMLSIEVKGGLAQAKSVLERTKIFALAESLGGVESLIEHPAIMTHASIPPAVRKERGITDALIRISCGIEDINDLIADLEHALKI